MLPPGRKPKPRDNSGTLDAPHPRLIIA